MYCMNPRAGLLLFPLDGVMMLLFVTVRNRRAAAAPVVDLRVDNWAKVGNEQESSEERRPRMEHGPFEYSASVRPKQHLPNRVLILIDQSAPL